MWKGVFATLQSGRYNLSYPRGRFIKKYLLMMMTNPNGALCTFRSFQLTRTNINKKWVCLQNTIEYNKTVRFTLLCKAKRQHLLTCKVSRYCLLAWRGSTGQTVQVSRLLWYTKPLTPKTFRCWSFRNCLPDKFVWKYKDFKSIWVCAFYHLYPLSLR